MQRGHNNSVTHFAVLLPCETDARDGMANFLPQGALFTPVRELTGTDLDKNSVRGRNTWGALTGPQRERLLGLIALRQAMEQKDALAVVKLAKAYETLATEIMGIHQGERPEKMTEQRFSRLLAAQKSGTAQRVLAETLTRSLSEARLVLWWKDSDARFLPALYCPNVVTALHARALLSAVGGKALLVCPHCGEPFVQQRSDQDYCSIRCREAHRVARWRAARNGRKKTRSSARAKR